MRVVLQSPTIIIPNEFVEIGSFIKLLAQSLTTVISHVKRNIPKVTTLLNFIFHHINDINSILESLVYIKYA